MAKFSPATVELDAVMRSGLQHDGNPVPDYSFA
jgi:hypothetical protein